MTIGLVRHLPVKKQFLKGWVTQAEMLQWFSEYNTAPLIQKPLNIQGDWDRCFSSQLSRAVDTAKSIFNGRIEQTELLNEPFPSPLFRRHVRLPFLIWAMAIRYSINSNHASQAHSKSRMEMRLQQFLDTLLVEEGNSLVVSHAFIMEVLSRQLIKAGFRGKKLVRPKNGVLYVFER